MKKINTLLVADAILSVLATYTIKYQDMMYVENYSNGREQGFTIVAHQGKTVSFFENRNSDEIVVEVKELNTKECRLHFQTIGKAVEKIVSILND